MTSLQFEGMQVDQLVAAFVKLCLAQDDAELHGDIAKVNRLFNRIETLKGELKARNGDQRAALIPLFVHSNAQVRLKAAKATLAIAPVAARKILEELAASNIYPQAGDAGMSLNALDQGIFKPT